MALLSSNTLSSHTLSQGTLSPKARSPKMASPNISRTSLAWLLAIQIFIIAPHLLTVPAWIAVVWVVVAFWRWQIFKGAWNYPGKLNKTLFAATCCAGLVASLGARFSYESMISLLLVGFILKLLEVKARRDFVLLVFIALFILATQFIEYNNIPSALYGFTCLMVLCAALMQLYRRSDSLSFWQSVRPSLMVLLQAIPFMVLLFVLVPRLGSFWAVPSPNSAKTGMSDSMSPGDFTQLMQSDELAFRASFTGEIPARDKLYWRGLVFSSFDGRRWFVSQRQQWRNTATANNNAHVDYIGGDIDYEVILEPSGNPWLYVLAAPHRWPQNMMFTRELLIQKSYPVTQRESYQITSALDYRLHPSDDRELADNRLLPREGNPETRRLAQEWMAEAGTPEKLIQKLFAQFHQGFTYTLSPQALGVDSVDDFLWRTHQGFCEHFAGSFVFFLRAAGVPARVVVGYQGGDINTVDNYLIVRQRDAHAWAEVWLEDRGWVMFDPTAAVAPDRINKGLSESLSASDSRLIAKPFGSSVRLLSVVRERWEALNYQWTRLVMNYDADLQSSLLERLMGTTSVARMALWVLGAGGCIVLMLAVLVIRVKKPAVPESLRIYRQLCAKLAAIGFSPEPGEAPGAFLRRVISGRPDLAPSLSQIMQLFELMVYADKATMRTQLRHRVASFKART